MSGATKAGVLPGDEDPPAVAGGGGDADGAPSQAPDAEPPPPAAHYYDQSTRGPACGHPVETDSDGRSSPVDGRYSKVWAGVTCDACHDARKKRANRKKRKVREPSERIEATKRAAAGRDQAILMLAAGANTALAMARRPPLPAALTVGWADSVITVAEYYGLEGTIDHPLAALALNSAILGFHVAQMEPIPVPEVGDDPLPELHKAAALELAGLSGS